ncbi:protein phosphatase regulator GAC1 [Aspergillus candidus]|uniref:Protein phosphatase regulatory subunit Gac1 n=1 Tax=Aspergillus candidus TaxID=41067 RepID=A0A2I2FAZ6_ASPCN|nr:protein phosphatase regulatory subunit Gac1 [Aspergillus candidus]PLB37789.1 protein phosphatase regulatory subunit Gac1 [Aspergillus candidus]
MPYTAPLKLSPPMQHIEACKPSSQSWPGSPTVDSKHSRLHLPRSYSSTAYLRKHRRSPSHSKVLASPDHAIDHGVDSLSSIRQSPPPITDASMPPGALISPPESPSNSSDEEFASPRQQKVQMMELKEAVRSIEQRRVPSPEREPQQINLSSSTIATQNDTRSPSHPPLSREARKISHSRSVTETSIVHHQEQAVTSSPDDSEREDEPRVKQPMLRKKSGELVRPALRTPSSLRRPSSMPGTPTFSKAVHFDAQLEHIRHFLQLDKPQAVSANTSPIEDYQTDEFPFPTKAPRGPSFEWELRLENFPNDQSSRALQRVRLERLFLSSDKTTLVGVVAVANLAFEKHVAARFTFDHWRTISEVTAEFNDDVRRKRVQDGYDRFSFSIKLNDQTHLEHKTLFICVRYNVSGQELWDNNDHKNYQVNFARVAKDSNVSQGLPVARPRPSLPRSKTFTGAGNRHSGPSAFDDLSKGGYFSFGEPPQDKNKVLDEVVRDTDAVTPIRREKPGSQAFSNRYDFGASLTAAMRTKPVHDRTTLTTQAKSVEPSDTGAHDPVRAPGRVLDKALPVNKVNQEVARPEPVQPSSLLSSKPHHESSVYKELVDRYCFYGSPEYTSGGTQPVPFHANDSLRQKRKDSPGSPSISPHSSASSSPNHSPSMDATHRVPTLSSPKPFEYRYPQNNFMKEAHTPTVIRG